MSNIDEQIDSLLSLGFYFNEELGMEAYKTSLRMFQNPEKHSIGSLISALGSFKLHNNEIIRFGKNTSTIAFDEYFIQNRISDILVELNRISNGTISFKIIDEFGPMINSNNSTFYNEFWGIKEESDTSYYSKPKEISNYFCRYEICDQLFEFDYQFFNPALILNPDFVANFCSKLEKIFYENNVNYFSISGEDITLFCVSQASQEVLANEPTVLLNKQLIKKYRKSEFQIQQEKIEQKKLKEQNEEFEFFSQGKINARVATKKEINLLENYKDKKLQEIIISFTGSTLLILMIVWGLNSEVLNLLPIRVTLWLFLGLAILFLFFVVYDIKIWLINRDLKQRKITKYVAIVRKVNHINGKTIIDLEKGVGPKYISEDYYLNLIKNDKIVITLFKESKMYLQLEKISRKEPSENRTQNSNVVLVTDKCPTCFAIVKENDYKCPECGIKFI